VKLAAAAILSGYVGFLFAGCGPAEYYPRPAYYPDDPYRVSPGAHGSLYTGIHGGK
jgi:hypothetical protein